MNKKAFTYNVTALIIVCITIIITVFFFANLYHVLTDTQNRQFCTVEGLKTEIGNIKEVSFFKTYELNCKAQKYILKKQDLASKIPSVDTLQTYGYDNSVLGKTDEIVRLNVKQHFASQLGSCWDSTGNRALINIKDSPANAKWGVGAIPSATSLPLIGSSIDKYLTDNVLTIPVVAGSTDRVAIKDKLLLSYLGYDSTTGSSEVNLDYAVDDYGTQTVPSRLADQDIKLPAIMCSICSTTYFDQDTATAMQNGPTSGSMPFTQFLSKTPISATNKNSLLALLRSQKGDFPKFPAVPVSGESVVYYQLFTNGDQAQSLDRTGVILLPQQDVANFCDVIVNQE